MADSLNLGGLVLEPVLAARQQVKILNADPNKAREGG